MKKEQTYKEAYAKLENLVEQLEDGNVPLEKLTHKVKQANELIAICEAQLRTVEMEVDQQLKGKPSKKKIV
jgi:exodeoxyribonuclease VII small subunit